MLLAWVTCFVLTTFCEFYWSHFHFTSRCIKHCLFSELKYVTLLSGSYVLPGQHVDNKPVNNLSVSRNHITKTRASRLVFELESGPFWPRDLTISLCFQPSLVVFTDDGRNVVEEDRDTRNSPSIDSIDYDPSQSHCQRKELFIDFR